jgi:hypothetical protein
MKVKADFSALRKTKWYEYAIRFLFGGLVTVMAGIIAKKFGPSFGGLFLAFPAIFPASLSLIDKHAKEKKRQAGLDGSNRGRAAAALDAKGAAIGTLGLIGFAFVVCRWIPQYASWEILMAATAGWILISTSVWRIRKAAKHGV